MRGRKPGSAAHVTAKSMAPSPPGWMGKEAVAEWNRIVPLLAKTGALIETDGTILACYCETFAKWKACSKHIERGVFVDGKPHPLLRVHDQLLKQTRGLLDQLGLTPAARKQIVRPEESAAATLEDHLA